MASRAQLLDYLLSQSYDSLVSLATPCSVIIQVQSIKLDHLPPSSSQVSGGWEMVDRSVSADNMLEGEINSTTSSCLVSLQEVRKFMQ